MLGDGALGLDWELQGNLGVRLHWGITGRTGTHWGLEWRLVALGWYWDTGRTEGYWEDWGLLGAGMSTGCWRVMRRLSYWRIRGSLGSGCIGGLLGGLEITGSTCGLLGGLGWGLGALGGYWEY